MNVSDLFERLPRPSKSRLPGFEGATAWLNSEPLTAADLRGKVVLADFWTFTCINWIRTLPYLRAWASTYVPHGLVVIGVHTPEFGLEHDLDNIRGAVDDLRVDYPIAVDNDYAVWDAFANQYWPALYLADAQGRIQHHHFGEGGYDRTEHVIRRLLVDAGATNLPAGPVVEPAGIELAADWDDVRSGETYVGQARSQGFASPGDGVFGEPAVYAMPAALALNQWALEGTWTLRREDAVIDAPGGRIAYRFHARDLNLILTPQDVDVPARFVVRLDGAPPGESHGLDVDEDGNGVVRVPRLHQLIRQTGPIDDRLFELELLDAGAAALCFTFG